MKYWLLVVIAVFILPVEVIAEPLSSGKWLVDLGRDYPLSPQAGLSDVDAEIALLLMQAATRIEPELAEGYRWQADLLQALGRDRQAADTLRAYTRLAPEDVPAQLLWVDLCIKAIQLAEERSAFCAEQLQRSDLPSEVASDLHRRQAEFYWNRGNNSQAIRHAETALSHDEHNLSARTILAELRPQYDEPIVQRIAMMLAQMKVNPGDPVLAKQLGDELVLLGMGSQADFWYRHADAVRMLVDSGPTPVALLLARATAMMDAGQLDEAEALIKQAMQLSPGAIAPMVQRMVIAWLKEDDDAANAYLNRLRTICKSFLKNMPEEVDPDLRAEFAWTLICYSGMSKAAERQARKALEDRPDSMIAQRALGSALRVDEQYDEAERVLATLANRDIWSALELARLHEAAERKEQAADLLRATAMRPSTFEQRRTMKVLMEQWEMQMPTTQPAALEAQALLDGFPKGVLDYPLHPEKYLSVALHVPGTAIPPAEPWRCTVRLDNVGPFPITIGPGLMLEPELLCLVEMRGERLRSSGPTDRVSLYRRLKLAPGESLTLTETLDIGAIRYGLIGTPQVSHEVKVSATTNPFASLGSDNQEIWKPGIGGIQTVAVPFRRVPFVVRPEQVRDLLARSRSSELNNRIVGMEVLAMLLAEHQHLAAGRLKYPAQPIDPVAAQATVLARADDPDWRVRARLAECMRWFVLDPSAMQAVAKLINDPHWLVRGLARRVLADQFGRKYASVLKTSAAADPDNWVRKFSAALQGRVALSASAAEKPSLPVAGK